MKQTQELNLEQDLELQFIPDFQTSPFTVTGDAEAVLPIADEIKALEATPAQTRSVAAIQAAGQAVVPKPVYEDFSTLAPTEVLRRKMLAWVHDRRYSTNMLGLLNERIADDRDVAFARDLGLLSVTHCAKHEKAVNALRGLTIKH